MEVLLTARDILELAANNLVWLGPALLLLSALAVADQLTDVVVRLMKRASREYRL